jgi:hypothetical protein
MGSALRGAFGMALKKTICPVKQRDCRSCQLYQTCLYTYIFETPPPQDRNVLRKHSHIPHPFVLFLMNHNQTDFVPGETLTFGLTLIGNAVNHLPFCVYALITMGKKGLGHTRGKYQLIDIRSLDEHSISKESVYDGEHMYQPQTILTAHHAQTLSDQFCGNQTGLELLTPVRLRFDNRLCNCLEFHIVIRNLLRRLSNLIQFHCQGQEHIPFNEFIEASTKIHISQDQTFWYDWRRFSSRKKKWMKLGGLKGKIFWQGPVQKFIPILVMGQWVHIGKNTGFGLGQYQLTEICNTI